MIALILIHLFFLIWNLILIFKHKEAKVIFFIPLLVYIAFTFIPFITLKENLDFNMVVHFLLFLLGFSLTFSFGIKEGIQNREAIVKIKERSPFIFPILFFYIIVISFTLFLIEKDIQTILQFFSCIVSSAIFYGIGMLLLYKSLQKEQKSKENKNKILNLKGSKKLLLINPGNFNKSGLNINLGSSFPPLGLGVIAALTPKDFRIKLIDENFDKFEYEDADLVAITAFTSVATRAYEIAQIFKKKGTPVVMGGIHVSMCPDEALEYVSCVAKGEAETIWPIIIQDFLKGKLKKRYDAVHADLKNMIIPNRELFSEKYLFSSIQTSRGCPMDCSFCSVTAFNGRKYRQRPVKDIIKELESIEQSYLFFVTII